MKTSRKLLWPLVILAVMVVGILAYMYFSNSDTGVSQTESEKAAAKADADTKKQLIEKEKPASDSSNNTNNPSPSNGEKITSLTAKQESNDTVTILTKLVSGTEGKCELAIKNGGQSANRSASIIYQPEFSTCAGFSLPISSVGYGQWSITLTASGSSKTIQLEVSR